MTSSVLRPLRALAVLAAAVLLACGCAGAAPDQAPASQRAAEPAGADQDPAAWPPAPVVPLPSQPPPTLEVDQPLAAQLAAGLVVIRYRANNLRIVPVYGPNALDVSPRIGHIHVVVDNAPWHWADASGEPLIIQALPPGPHMVWIGLADPTHKIMDSRTVSFVVPAHGSQSH